MCGVVLEPTGRDITVWSILYLGSTTVVIGWIELGEVRVFGTSALITVFIALVAIGLAGTILSLMWFSRLARYRVTSPETTACWSCRYDVRGNPAGSCPECGAELGYAAFDHETIESDQDHV